MSDPTIISVDLKWSLWSTDWGIWNWMADRQPDLDQPGFTWNLLKAAFEGTHRPVRVHTSPRKEIRFGTVTISEGAAHVYFEAVWDEASDLVGLVKYDLTDEQQERAIEHIKWWFWDDDPCMCNDSGDNLGAKVEQTLWWSDFDGLMRMIDQAEEELLRQEREREKAFDEYIDGYLKVQLGLAEDDGSY